MQVMKEQDLEQAEQPARGDSAGTAVADTRIAPEPGRRAMDEGTIQEPHSVDPQLYKQTLARWATGVTVVGAVSDGKPLGITANSFTSLSLNPPQVLISVNKRLYTHEAIRTSGRYAVSILREEQVALGKRFAGMIPEIEDRFAGVPWFTARTGCPILTDALAWVDCEVAEVYDGEDHSIFVGHVLAAGLAGEGHPLLYFNRDWRALAQEPAVEPGSSAL